MSTVLAYPPRRARPLVEVLPPLPAAAGTARAATLVLRSEYDLTDLARRLGLLQFGVRTIIDKLRVLARNDGMPLPRTPRIIGQQVVRGPLVIYAKSRWNAGEIDAWLDGHTPGGAPAPRPVAPAIVVDMARRAAEIANVA